MMNRPNNNKKNILLFLLLSFLGSKTKTSYAFLFHPTRHLGRNARGQPRYIPPKEKTGVTRTTTTSTKLEIVPSRNRLKDLAWKTPSDDEVTDWMRKYGEVSRYYRRDVFTPGDWVRFRRPSRYMENIRTTFKSGLLRQVSKELTVLAALSCILIVYNNGLRQVFAFLPLLKLPLVPFQLAAASLGLLLTFRTNVSYQRWNEARTAWGRVINDSRSLVRMACVWSQSYYSQQQSPSKKDALLVRQKRLGEAVCAFSRTLMNRTLPSQEDEKNYLIYCFTQLSDQDYARRLLRAPQHRPTAALAEITSLLVQFQLHPLHHMEIETMVTELCSSMGACERILSSPVPTFYSRHTTRFLVVWLYLLPLALYSTISSWVLVPIMVVLGGFLLGIEELANQMEEPFSILPMEQMCENSIRKPVMEQVERSKQYLQHQQQPEPEQQQKYQVNMQMQYNDNPDKYYHNNHNGEGSPSLPSLTRSSSTSTGGNNGVAKQEHTTATTMRTTTEHYVNGATRGEVMMDDQEDPFPDLP